MIAIMGVDSANTINQTDTDTAQIRLIPSRNLDVESKPELSFYKPLFEKDTFVVDHEEGCIYETDVPKYFWDFIISCIENGNFPTAEQLDPNNYYLKSQLPTFLNKFVAMALTEPAGVSAETYIGTCHLLQANPALMTYNQATTPPKQDPRQAHMPKQKTHTLTTFYPLSRSQNAPITITEQGITVPDYATMEVTDFSFYDLTQIQQITIGCSLADTLDGRRCMIIHCEPTMAKTTSKYGYFYIEKQATNKIRLIAGATSGNTSSTIVDTSDMNINLPITIQYIKYQENDTAHLSVRYTKKLWGSETIVSETATITSSQYLKNASMLFGTFVNPDATITGEITYSRILVQSFNKERILYYKASDNNTINEELLTII